MGERPVQRVMCHLAAIAVSATLINLANPGGARLGLLAWLAFAPWLRVIADTRALAAGLSGLVMGLAWTIPLHWTTFWTAIGGAGVSEVAQTAFALALFCVMAAPFAIFGALQAWLAPQLRTDALLWPLAQAGLLASSISLTWVPFPYTPAVSLVDQPAIMQWASIGGEPLLLMFLFWPGAFLAVISRRMVARVGTAAVVMGVAFLSALGYGIGRMERFDRAQETGSGATLSALAVQLNVSRQASAWMLTRQRIGGRRSAFEVSQSALHDAPHCEMVVWPEIPLDAQRSKVACGAAPRLADALGVPLMAQCFRAQDQRRMITAEWISGQDARWHGKSSLIPLYERPLFGDGTLLEGRRGTTFVLDGRRIIPALCYELHSRAHLRSGVMSGGQMAIHMANYAAFDGQPIEAWDEAMAQIRAAEFGVPVLRSANKGTAALIDANGRIRERLDPGRSDARCLTLWAPGTGPTWYAYISPVAGWLPALLSLVLAWCLRRDAQASADYPAAMSKMTDIRVVSGGAGSAR